MDATTNIPAPTTEDVLAGMLQENTGRHMLDSGGAYGRNWERNQGRNFADEPEAVLRADHGYLDITVSLYHFLRDRLDYDPAMQARFDAFAERPENERCHWLELMESFPEYLRDRFGEDVSGLYGDGARGFTVNTYNGEDLLTQIIQYHYFEIDGDPFVLLQVHGGCDVRGGYTAPRAFQITADDTSLFDNARATIYCSGGTLPGVCEGQIDLAGNPVEHRCYASWDTDDGGYHLYENNDGSAWDFGDPVEADEGKVGQVTVLPDGRVICPCCGTGELKAAAPYGGG